MAIEYIDDATVDEADAEETRALDVLAILEAESLIELLDDNQITTIGQACLRGFEDDWESRNQGGDDATQSWKQRYERYLDIAMQVRKPKTFPWPNASNIKYPILTTAAIQFNARAYPVIVDGANLVKGRVLGPDNGVPQVGPNGEPIVQPNPENPQEALPLWRIPPGAKRERADRIAAHMTWQLLFGMPGWEEDTDRLLLQLPIVGCMFRKTYYDPVEQRPCTRTVSPLDFVINYWATSIEDAPRFTHVLRFYPHEIEERFRSGVWRRITLPVPQDEKDQSETAPVEFLEQHCRIDLDEDGYPEPYIVTLTREGGHVVRIEPCFDVDGVLMNERTGEVIRIERKRYFTKYGFIPAPDGSFYDIGFGSLLDDITAGVDTALNQLLDAGALANAQGGFLGSGVKVRSGDIRFRLGEWKRLDVTGGTLRDNIVPLSLPGPNAVLFNLLQFLVNAAKEITAVQDVLTGQAQGVNTPVGTVLAQIEQALKVMTAIFKRIHRAFWNELQILRGLNKDFLDEEAYFALADTVGVVGKRDYDDKDIDVMPVSDPTAVADAQRIMRGQALLQFNGDPLVNQTEIRRRYFEATGQTNVRDLLTVPPPQPDPKILLDGKKQANERDKTLAEIRAKDAAAAASLMTAAQTATALNLLPDAAAFAAAARTLGTQAGGIDDGPDAPDQPGGAEPMAQSADDTGVHAVPRGPEGEPDGGLGLGPVDGPPIPGPGDDLDNAYQPESGGRESLL